MATQGGAARRAASGRVLGVLGAAALVAAITIGEAAAARGQAVALRPPARLADTGLYADFAARTVDPRNLPYAPQYPLWSDGAVKRRWIYLPPGTAIDARDPEVWIFPVGTKLWKEFSWTRRVETRYLERTRAGWIYAAYAWRDDEGDAVLVGEQGARTSTPVTAGRTHAIPSVSDCKSCHQGGRAEILGFAALQLSSDRDPLAPHREPLEPGMPTLETLVARGLVRGLPQALLAHPPRIDAPTPRGRAAMGYLHANCSICHDSVGPLAALGVDLRQPLRRRDGGAAPAAAAIGWPTRFRVAGDGPRSVWIDPGAPASSAVVARMGSRSAVVQMPPLGSQVVDDEALALIRSWIELDLHPATTAGAVPTE